VTLKSNKYDLTLVWKRFPLHLNELVIVMRFGIHPYMRHILQVITLCCFQEQTRPASGKIKSRK